MFSIQKSKLWFFSGERVIRLITVGQVRALSKIGAFVRQRARTSIRKSNSPPVPGQPPRSRIGTLRNLLYFAYDPDAQTVVVGPAAVGVAEAPRLLEEGGEVTRLLPARQTRKAYTTTQAAAYAAKVRSGQLVPPPRAKTSVSVRYNRFAYMGPALRKEIAAGTMARAFAEARLLGP